MFKANISSDGWFCGSSQSEEPKLPDRRLQPVQVETLWSGHMSALSALRKAEHAWCRTRLSHTPSVPSNTPGLDKHGLE